MAEPLKNLYNKPFFQNLGKTLKKEFPKFSEKAFLKAIFSDNWADKELKERMRHITLTLHEMIEMPFPQKMKKFKKVIQGKEGFEFMFFPDYVEVFGMDDLATSLDALAAFTPISSSEFAIRPFIVKYEKQTLAQLKKWAKSKDEHLRRLASEGCRPRLPWAMGLPKFKKDPSLILPILESLKHDESEYVRRSVANNLNDISKDHPGLVLKMAKAWLGNNKDTDRLVKHACRTLLKAGNIPAMMLFGFADPKKIQIKNLQVEKKTVKVGDYLHFSFDVINTAKKPQVLRLEYQIDFQTKSGKISQKVFKITENTFGQEPTTIKRKQSFSDFTTRKHYPGEHILRIIVNGVSKDKISFQVKK